MKTPSSEFAQLPQIDRLLRSLAGDALLLRYPRPLVAQALRDTLDEARESIREGAHPPEIEQLLDRAGERLDRHARPSLRKLINATGIVIHTNLGRSALAPEAIRAVVEAAEGYSNLEYDLETGRRGSRHSHVDERLRRLTGAEAAAVFNNNAGAVFLALTALAHSREVVVSRGQLVEIGGSFRVPEIVQSGGARLVEVGTTNRTRLSDYRRAVTPETALFLKVHPSNYRIQGFTEAVGSAELAALGREIGIPVMEDLGSGAVVDLSSRGVGDEPTVRSSVEAGVDLIAFSGDKLLGGPQAGILVGKAGLVAEIRRHPLARALRCDKMTLAALEATLKLYEEDRAWESIPTLRFLARTSEEIGEDAKRLVESLSPPLRGACLEGHSQVGGGSLPGERLPTVLVSLAADGLTDADLAVRLRRLDPPLVGRTQGGRVLLDLRTVEPADVGLVSNLLEGLRRDLQRNSSGGEGNSKDGP